MQGDEKLCQTMEAQFAVLESHVETCMMPRKNAMKGRVSSATLEELQLWVFNTLWLWKSCSHGLSSDRGACCDDDIAKHS